MKNLRWDQIDGASISPNDGLFHVDEEIFMYITTQR